MLRYSRHARDRMRERQISEEEVEYCVNFHNITRPGREGTRILTTTTTTGRKIQVVVNFSDEDPYIVTVEEWG